MTRYRVLMTVDAVGGVWQYACELCAALRQLGIEVVLALLGPPPSRAQRDELDDAVILVETGLELDWLSSDARSVEEAGWSIASLLQHFEIDLVHLNQPAFAASAIFTTPVVTTIHSCVATWWQAVHGDTAPSSFAWQAELTARGLCRSDAVVAPTRSFAEAVQRTYALDNAPFVVPNGRRSPPPGFAARQDMVFTAGRLWDQGKNIATLDQVAARTASTFAAAGATRGPRGDGIELRHMKALGPLDSAALAACLATCPVYVSAAYYEPFGLAVLEAALAGCALVLSDIPTFREIWGDAAVFVEPCDEDRFVATIEMLMRDGDLRMRRGELARERAARFTPARMAAGMNAIYARALAGRDEAQAVA